MNLISCNECGVVLDKDRITKPNVFTPDIEYIQGNSVWDGDKYVSVITCPVCKSKIRYG